MSTNRSTHARNGVVFLLLLGLTWSAKFWTLRTTKGYRLELGSNLRLTRILSRAEEWKKSLSMNANETDDENWPKWAVFAWNSLDSFFYMGWGDHKSGCCKEWTLSMGDFWDARYNGPFLRLWARAHMLSIAYLGLSMRTTVDNFKKGPSKSLPLTLLFFANSVPSGLQVLSCRFPFIPLQVSKQTSTWSGPRQRELVSHSWCTRCADCSSAETKPVKYEAHHL